VGGRDEKKPEDYAQLKEIGKEDKNRGPMGKKGSRGHPIGRDLKSIGQ